MVRTIAGGTLAALVGACVHVTVAAQNGRIGFEAVSVRPAVGGVPIAQRVLPTRIDFVNTPMRTVLFAAYRLIHREEASFPEWLLETRFDIQGTYPPGVTSAQVPEMLQTLLKERFGLVAHMEPRRIEGFELAVSKDGVKMREVQPLDELDKDFSASSGPRLTLDMTSESVEGRARTLLIPDEIGLRTITARSFYELRTLANGIQRIDATRITMSEFASVLRVNLGQPVFDKTGLTGVYQFRVELDRLARPIVIIEARGPRDPTGASTFKAVEGLGLTLRELQSPVNVLVVDNINRTPTEN